MAAGLDLLQDLMLLSRAAQVVLQDEVIRDLDQTEISASRANILRLLGRQGRQSVNDIATFLGQTKASASQNVDCLVRAGILCRETDPEDRRCVWVSLTPQGKRLLEKAENRQLEVLRKALGGLAPATMEKLSRGMRSLAFALLDQSGSQLQTCLQGCAYDSAGCVRQGSDWHCTYMLRSGVRGSRARAGSAPPPRRRRRSRKGQKAAAS
jgi:DNA-binding MarR family transcriptional regulator